MIYDKIENLESYKGMYPNLAKALAYLSNNDLSKLKLGKNEVLREQIYLMVQKNKLKSDKPKEFEYHRRYADIHIVIEGEEQVTYGTGEEVATKPYDEGNDFGLVNCSETYTFSLSVGNFLLFLPEEAHQAGKSTLTSSEVKKYVVKVLI